MKKRLQIIFILFFALIPTSGITGEKVKIAAVMEISGNAGSTYLSLLKTIRFAVDEVNQQGGFLGKEIELIEIDNRNSVIGSRQAAEKAVAAGVIAVIGSIRSSNSMAMAPVLQKARIPMISPCSTNPKITLAGNYIFRICFNDLFQSRVMAFFALNDLKAKTAVVLTNTKNRYCTGLAENFIKEFNAMGGMILWEGDYLEKVTDFNALIKKTKKLKPDVIFIPGYVKDSAHIIKKARVQSVSATFIGGDGWSDIMYDYAGQAIIGSYYSTCWHPDLPLKESRKFVKQYRKLLGEIKYYSVALAYDAVMILAEAVDKSDSIEPEKIQNALAAIKGFKGVTGRIGFDKNGDPIKPAVILKFKNNRSVYVKTVLP